MKLHLPKMLTAALFAAFISFTQASGTELSDAKLSLADFTQESLDAAASQAGGSWVFTNITGDESGVYTSESGKQGSFTSSVNWTTRVDSNRTIWSAIVTVDGESLLDTFGTGFGYVIQQNTGAPLGIGYTNGKATSSWQGGANGNPVNKALNQCLDGNGNITLGIIYKGNGGCTIYVVDGQENEYHIDNTGLKGGYTTDLHPRIDLTPAAGIEYKSLYVFGGLVADDDMKAMMKGLVAPAVVSSYTWSATGETAAWDTNSTTTWAEAVAYKNSLTNTVTFGADAGLAKAVTVDEDIKAGTVAVNDSYTFTVASGHSLDVVELSLAAGKKLTLDGAGTTSISNLTNNGEIAINKDARLDLDTVTANNTDLGTITTGEGTLAIETVVISGGNGKITFENATDNGTVQLTGGKVIYGGEAEHVVQNLRLSHGGQQVSTVDVLAGATLHIEGTLVGKDQPSRMNGSFSLSHWSAANVVNVYGTLISDVVVSSCDGTGTINVYEGGRLEMRDGLNRGNYNNNAITINVAGGATLATGTTYNTTETKNSDTMIVSLADGATLEAYYKGAATTANIAKAMTLGGVTVKTGDSGKTLTLSGALTANGTIAQTGEGALVLAGAIDITGNTGELAERYVGGQTDGNGFLESSGLITIYTGDNVSLDEAAVITYHGDNVTADVHEGKYAVSATVDYSAFYVKSGSELISTALTHPEVGSVVLSAATTINMDAATSMAVAVVEGADNTTIAATEDVTITSLTGLTDGKTLTISAAGHEVALQGDNTFRGNLVVDKGTLKLDTGDRKKVLGEFNGSHAKGQAAPAPDKTITINEGGTIDLNGKSDLTYVYTLNGGSLVNTGNAIGAGSMQTVGIKLEKDSYVGGTGNFYLLGAGYDNTFVELNNHKLTKTGANSIGFRNTNVTSGTIEVKEGNIEFVDGDNSLLAANIILDGGSISGTVRASGEISVTAKQESTLNGLAVRSGQVDLIGTVNVSGGSLDLSNADQSTGTLRVSDGSVLNANSTLWLCSTSKIEVEEGGTFNIAGLSITAPSEDALITSDSNDYYGTGKANFTIANAAITATADVTIGNTLNDVDVNTGAHTVTIATDADVVKVAEGGILNIGEAGSANAINVENGGAIGTYVKADSGETTITSMGGAAVLKNAIALNAGSLTMTGTYSIDDLDGEIVVTDYVHGEHEDNGFAIETGTIEFVTVAPESEAVLDTTGAQIMRGGNAATVVGGVATVNSTNYSTFYITNLSETVTQAKSQEASSGVTLASIHVSNGATLDVNQDINLSLVTAETGAKLNILSGQTVSVGDATTTATIAGAGTYALKGGSKTMTGTLAEGSDWKGTVVVSSVGSFADINLNTFGHEGSKVKFDGVTGHFGPHIITYAPELVLGEGGLTLNNGYSTDGQGGPDTVYTFAGGVSGTGNMTFNRTTGSTVRQQLVFSGDVSEWTGTLSVVARFNVTAHYIGVDKTVNSTISRTGGDLHVKVGTGEDASVVTFAQGITANDLAVLAGATAIVNGGLTANTITVDEGGSLTMNGGTLATAITSSGSVTLTGVTLDSTVFTEQTGIDAGISKYDIYGALVPDAVNYYAGTKTYLEVVSVGGSGSNLTWGTRTDLSMVDGRVITGEGARIADTFYVTADTVLYSSLLAGTENVEVSGGKFQIDQEASNINIHVSGDGVIAGYVEPEQVKEAKIEQGATATFEGVTTLDPGETNTHVTITSDTSEKVAITNVGETDEAISYEGLGQAAAKVTADAVEVQAEREADVTIANALEVQSITNNSEHTLYLDGEVVTEALNAAAGDITLHNVAEPVELGSLTIGDNVAVGAYQGTDEEALQEATVVISQTLTAGEESVLHANLELKDGATLNFTGTLTMTSDLDVQGTLTLDEDSALYQELASFAAGSGKWIDLIMAADGSNLAYINPGLHGVNAAEVFTNDLFRVNNDYMVFATEDSFGITRVPEPTTGTLSLLALAALAARRRKH